MLRSRYGIDPNTLDDKEWAALEAQREFIERHEDERFVGNFKTALIPILNELFRKR